MTMKAVRCHLCATAIAAVIATAIATMGKALPSSDNRIQPGCGDDGGDGGSMAMAARRGRRRGKGGGDGGGAARAAAMAAARRRWRRRWRGQGGESMDEAG
jgi:hypothetical protein